MKYYTATSLARAGIIPVSQRSTIVQMIKRGDLRAHASNGNGRGVRYTISKESVEEYLKKIN